MIFPPWTAATGCSNGPQPGAKALLSWILDVFDEYGAYSAGIFSCRPVRGGSGYSLHAEGRGIDVGFPLVGGKANPAGTALVQTIRPQAAKVGVQCIIWHRRIWSAKSPEVAGRPYPGVHPHYDHVHLELTPRAAAVLNLATVRHWLGTDDVDLSDAEQPKRKPPASTKPVQHGRIEWERYNRSAKPGARVLARGAAGEDVRYVQKFIGKTRAGVPDGKFGDRTTQAVRWYQTRCAGVKVTGRVDEPTWKYMLGR